MQKYFFLGLLFLFLSACGNHSFFPKKYLGSYHGMQESYKVEMGGEAIEIPPSEYRLVLDYGKLWLSSPQQKIAANYKVTGETEMYYTLVVDLENGVVEEWQLWKKGKRLIRKANAPRPELIFIAD